MMLRVSVILSFWLANRRLLRNASVAAAATASCVEILKPLDPTEGIDGGLEDVVGVVRAQRLGQDILNARRFQHGTDRPPRDDPGARHRRLEEDTACTEMAGDLARD